MQKQRCHEFAAQMGWDIVREFSEKGVSGFKVSAKQRDAIQEIQREAALNTFDILLVFMFDRLGRRDDETPFIVEWFVNNGIEVWSAEEGQQRFDNHVDKLLNYIRYWQASGESIKTSIRTKTRLGQIVMEGRFRGGYAPYGYQLVKKGREQRSAEYLTKCEAAGCLQTIQLQDGSEMDVSRPPRSYPRKNMGSALLSGNVYCGHCGGRLFASTARKTHHPVDGTNGRVAIYKCYNRTQHKGSCDGPTTYRAEKVDAVVSKIIHDVLQKAGTVRESDIVSQQIGATAVDLNQQIRQSKLELSRKRIELGKLEGLMLDSLDGKCVFTPEQVKSRMDSVQEAMTSLSANIESLESRLHDSEQIAKELAAQHKQLLSWAEMFDNATPAERKLIASHLIRAVTLTRGYGIQIDFNISEAQYLNGMKL